MKPKPRRESEVKAEIQKLLKRLGVLCFRMNSGAIPLEHKGRKRYVRMASPGTADLLAFVGSIPLWIECKREGEALSEDQVLFRNMMVGMGHKYVVATNCEVVMLVIHALRSIEQ